MDKLSQAQIREGNRQLMTHGGDVVVKQAGQDQVAAAGGCGWRLSGNNCPQVSGLQFQSAADPHSAFGCKFDESQSFNIGTVV